MLDLSSDAIDVARINARENGVSDRAQFKVCDVGKADFEEEEKFFAILSNPPYVTEDAYKELAPEIYKEPGMAFVGGADGADFYRLIIPMYGKYLAEDGFFAFEIGFDQGEILVALGESNGYDTIILKDIEGRDRVAVLKRH